MHFCAVDVGRAARRGIGGRLATATLLLGVARHVAHELVALFMDAHAAIAASRRARASPPHSQRHQPPTRMRGPCGRGPRSRRRKSRSFSSSVASARTRDRGCDTLCGRSAIGARLGDTCFLQCAFKGVEPPARRRSLCSPTHGAPGAIGRPRNACTIISGQRASTSVHMTSSSSFWLTTVQGSPKLADESGNNRGVEKPHLRRRSP